MVDRITKQFYIVGRKIISLYYQVVMPATLRQKLDSAYKHGYANASEKSAKLLSSYVIDPEQNFVITDPYEKRYLLEYRAHKQGFLYCHSCNRSTALRYQKEPGAPFRGIVLRKVGDKNYCEDCIKVANKQPGLISEKTKE